MKASTLINSALLITAACYLGVVVWYNDIVPEMDGYLDFQQTDSTPICVTVPLGGMEYIDVMLDGINSESECITNKLTTWDFGDAKILRTKDHLSGQHLEGNCMYLTNRNIYIDCGEYYVDVISDTQTLAVSVESLVTAESYTVPCPDMNEHNQRTSPPTKTTEEEFVADGVLLLPIGATKLEDNQSYYKGSKYFNYNFRYQKMEDARQDAGSRVCAMSGQDLNWWYEDSDVFICNAGDEYVAVKKDTYTSCYFMSSNDLNYILWNLED